MAGSWPETVVFWTAHYDPRCEAISREIRALRQAVPHSRVLSLTEKGRPAGIAEAGACWLRPRTYRAAARPLAWWLDRGRPVHHIFHGWPPTPFLARLRGRRTVMTCISALPEDWDHRATAQTVRLLAVECPRVHQQALAAGWPEERLRCILPGVDLDEFHPAPPPPAEKPFTVVFAGVPFLPGYAEARGLDVVLGAARLMPEVRFRLLCRGYVPGAVEEVRRGGPANLEIETTIHADMHAVYTDCHATVAPFRAGLFNKSCPNSLIESLASGRPVLASEEVGIAPFLAEQRAAVTFPPTPEGLANAVEALRSRYEEWRSAARPCAERHFGLPRFLDAYRDLYAGLE